MPMHPRAKRSEILRRPNVADAAMEVRQVVVHQRSIDFLPNLIHKACEYFNRAIIATGSRIIVGKLDKVVRAMTYPVVEIAPIVVRRSRSLKENPKTKRVALELADCNFGGIVGLTLFEAGQH